MGLDVTEVERALRRIPEISAARIVTDPGGRPVEVHILSSTAKHPKQLVRDVQSVAMATFGLDLDRRMISVVQLEVAGEVSASPEGSAPYRSAPTAATTLGQGAASPPAAVPRSPDPQPAPPQPSAEAADAAEADTAEADTAEPVLDLESLARSVPAFPAGPPAAGTAHSTRIAVENVQILRSGVRCTAEVVLRRGTQQATGEAEGLMAASASVRLVAEATIRALRHLEPAASRADLESATVVRMGDRHVALATVVVIVPPYEEVVTGSAVVRSAGDLDAVARSVLDATNRRLPQLR